MLMVGIVTLRSECMRDQTPGSGHGQERKVSKGVPGSAPTNGPACAFDVPHRSLAPESLRQSLRSELHVSG